MFNGLNLYWGVNCYIVGLKDDRSAVLFQCVSHPVIWRCCWEWTSGPCGDAEGERRGVSGRLESFKNFGGVICVRSDLPYSQLMVSNVASVCMCVSGVGFDREVENWRMSLRSELVAVEVWEQLVTPAPALRLKCQDPESRGFGHTFPLRRNAGRLIRAINASVQSFDRCSRKCCSCAVF